MALISSSNSFISRFLFSNLSYLSLESNPTSYPFLLNLKSALSLLKRSLNSAREVSSLYGSIVPLVTKSSIKTPM